MTIAFYSAPKDLLTPRTFEPIVVGETVTYDGKPELCETGLHASVRPEDAVGYRSDGVLTLVEIGGEVVVGNDKVCGQTRKTLCFFPEYDKVRASALAEYNKVCESARAECDKVWESALAEFDKVRASARAEYNKVCVSAYAEYNKVCAPAWAEFDKVRASALDAVKEEAKKMGWVG